MINPDRQIVLDTETTGMTKLVRITKDIALLKLVPWKWSTVNIRAIIFTFILSRIVWLIPSAIKVHGITDEMLADKPDFKTIAQDFIEYIRGAELLIHNAPFAWALWTMNSVNLG